MIKVDLTQDEHNPYAKGKDDDGNTYYYSSKKKFYLCFATSGSIGLGKTTKEALEYARCNKH